MVAARRLRLVRIAGGGRNLELFAVAGIATVLVTRGYLALTDYPQLGGGTLHIAHVLWGGLLMLGALMLTLFYFGPGLRTWAALIGGAGFGLFVDEVGKFVTSRTDYFYRPAAAIIYLVFALLVILARRTRSHHPLEPPERYANAAFTAVGGLSGGLTPEERRGAAELVASAGTGPGSSPEVAASLRRLLEVLPEREAPRRPLHRIVAARLAAAAEWLLRRRWLVFVMIIVFVLQALLRLFLGVAVGLALAVGGTLELGPEPGAAVASVLSGMLSAALAIAGAIRLRRHRRQAFELFRAAILVDVLLTQVFNFTTNQFGALAGLAFDLLSLAVVSYELDHLRTNDGPATAGPHTRERGEPADP
ncbi:hypothetical protein [Pseudonocardia sp. H11422]|uniref:hypothetical protein n=1 Tax=Pseudonocardia sp. H11422 TaxID=2835866 RepID=UPI001BDC1C2B|nr:hypothetical protein [Pseudonocardia sp. H11422]